MATIKICDRCGQSGEVKMVEMEALNHIFYQGDKPLTPKLCPNCILELNWLKDHIVGLVRDYWNEN